MGKVELDELSDKDIDDEIRALAKSGARIAAIKFARAKYNCGLREAEDHVDSLVPRVLDDFDSIKGRYRR